MTHLEMDDINLLFLYFYDWEHLSYQLRKHFFCLGVCFGEVGVEGAVCY